MLSITNPKYFVPVHGEYRHLKAHAKIAYELRQSESNTFVLENGDVLEITSNGAKMVGTVPSGTRYIDGKTYWGTKSNILSERRSLSHKGVVFVNIVIDKKNNSLIGPPILSSIGFQNDAEEDKSLQSASKMVQSALEEKWLNVLNLDDIEVKIVESISAHLYKETRKRPVVLPSVRII
jgi:ribonuclease J